MKVVAGAVIKPGACGADDITSENLDRMANTLENRSPTDDDRRELVDLLRWMAGVVRGLELDGADDSPPSGRPPSEDS